MVMYVFSIFIYYPFLQIIDIYSISVYTETIINPYFTTYAQVILIKCYKSTAPYISS